MGWFPMTLFELSITVRGNPSDPATKRVGRQHVVDDIFARQLPIPGCRWGSNQMTPHDEWE